VRDEADLYRAVDLDSFRRNCGKLRAIRSGEQHSVPKLIEKEKSARHVFIAIPSQATVTIHSKKWPKRRELGLEYLGIADHSRSSVKATGIAAKSCSRKSSRFGT